MAVARRIYLYAIAFVALGILAFALTQMLVVIASSLIVGIAPYPVAIGRLEARGAASSAAALATVGLVTWLIHWQFANRSVEPGERGATTRKLMLAAVLLLGDLSLLGAARDLITDAVAAAIDGLSMGQLLSGRIVAPAAWLVVGGPLVAYHRRTAAIDRQLAPEVGAAATLRRVATYGLAFVALLVFIFGVVDLGETIWRARIVAPGSVDLAPDWPRSVLPRQVGAIVAGGGFWLWAWFVARARLADAGPDPESASVLRKIYLYGALALAVSWTVWSHGQILYGLVRLALLAEQVPGGWTTIVRQLGEPTIRAIAFGALWAGHVRVLADESARTPELERQATIRWLYQYLAALVGLVATAWGLAGTLATTIDRFLITNAVRPTHWWEDRIALFSTLVVVGLPLWLSHWTRLQREAVDPTARRSVVRRVYVLALFALGVLALLGSVAYVLYQALRLVMGEAWTGEQPSDLIAAASTVTIVGVLLAYHLRVLRSDLTTPAPGGSGEHHVIVIVGSDSAAGIDRIRHSLAREANASLLVEIEDVDAGMVDAVRGLLGKPRETA